jgi:hypothetical protein
MAKQLPCPNPACKHIFSAEEIQSAELLKCPQCGQMFRFRPPAAAAPTPMAPAPKAASPAAPVAKPAIAKAIPVAPGAAPASPARPAAPAVPVAPIVRPVAPQASPGTVDVESVEQPVALPEPEENPFAIRTAAPAVEDDTPLVRSRRSIKKGWTAKHYTILASSLLVVAALVAGVIVFRGNLRDLFRAERQDRDGGSGRPYTVRNLANKEERVFRLAPPERWAVDKDLRVRLNAITAWKNEERDAWLVIAVQDYGQQRPRDSELMKAAIERLEGHFGDALELAKRAMKSDLVGEECQVLPFKGTFNSVTWYGECFLLAHRGFGYWFIVATSSRWGTVDDAHHVKTEFEKSKSFALATERAGWTEQPPKMETFHAQSGGVSITAPAGVWEKGAARDIEETGELFLFGRFLREKDNRKNASVLIFTSEKKGDLKESLREARTYLEKRKQEENAKYKYVAAEDAASLGGGAQPIGDHPGYQTELKLLFNDEPRRYALLSVVHHDDKAYVILCDCAWENRQIWQQDFRNALATMKWTRKE